MNIEMNPTPTITEDIKPIAEPMCSQQESQARLDICKSCENFAFNEHNITYCTACGCNINMLIAIRSQTCPKEKW